jgi:hypothetical protein
MREDESQRRGRGSRWFAVGCGGLAGAALVLLLAYLWWANQLPPPEPEVRVLPNPNGFDLAIDAASRLAPTQQSSPLASPTTADPAVLRPLVTAERPALDALRAAMKQEWLTPAYRDFNALFPYLAQFRDGARKFVAESRVEAAADRNGEAMQRALDAVELGADCGRGAPLIHNLAGAACMAIGTRSAERLVSQLSAPEAREAGRRMDGILGELPSEADVFQEERKLMLLNLRRLFAGQLASPAGAGSPVAAAQSRGTMFFWPKSWTYRSVDQAMRAHIARAETPYQQRKPVPPPTEMYAKLMTEPLQQSSFVFVKRDAIARLLRLELALQAHRAAKGQYPAALREVSSGLAPIALTDPFSGKPFIYRRTAGGYLLYSVGPDGVDDGGRVIYASALKETSAGDLVAGALGPPPSKRDGGSR